MIRWLQAGLYLNYYFIIRFTLNFLTFIYSFSIQELHEGLNASLTGLMTEFVFYFHYLYRFFNTQFSEYFVVELVGLYVIEALVFCAVPEKDTVIQIFGVLEIWEPLTSLQDGFLRDLCLNLAIFILSRYFQQVFDRVASKCSHTSKRIREFC